MKGSFFPEYSSRVNCNFIVYSTIAIRAFCAAEKALKRIILDDDLLIDGTDNYLVDENIVVCETFAAFAIESYLNTYAAACLGDSIFYDNYERLSVISKIQLISAILYQEHIEKGSELYYLLKHTFSARDQHAHNKSRHLDGNTWDEVLAAMDYSRNHIEEEYENVLSSERERLTKEVNDAFLGIKTMVAVACYIDSHDSTANAKLKLLHIAPDWEVYGSTYDENMINIVSELIKTWSKKC